MKAVTLLNHMCVLGLGVSGVWTHTNFGACVAGYAFCYALFHLIVETP